MEKTILFDGTDLSLWHPQGNPDATPDWVIEDGVMTVGHCNIQSRVTFSDAQLHVEFRTPYMPDCQGQARGNSGVYVHGCYEIQVLDSYGKEEAREDDCGGLYSISKPLTNACLPPETWQTYDIIIRAPRFNQYGEVSENGRMTVIHNGICIHNNIELPSVTPGGVTGDRRVAEGCLMLQDHGDRVSYRNIWIRKL